MRDIWKLAWKLLLIAAIAGLALGATNELTKGPIAEQVKLAADEARKTVLPAADNFALVSEGQNGCDSIYQGTKGGTPVGYTAQVTVRGYGGLIEVTVGRDTEGVITGVSVGGASFAETAGLGAKTKDAAFREQYIGQSGPGLTVDKAGKGADIDAVSGATISSTAVTGAVNTACTALEQESAAGGVQ
ncbi:MAG: FMN-binding protein [Eubacteriales bacterium]|nr:FMN-binding protein [Eubacteriales bacterium]